MFSLVRPLSLKVATDKNNLISSFRFSPSQPFYFLPWSEIKEQYDQTRGPQSHRYNLFRQQEYEEGELLRHSSLNISTVSSVDQTKHKTSNCEYW